MDKKTQDMPKIIFKVDHKAEKRTAAYFLKQRKINSTGLDEYEKFIRDYPELKATKELSLKEAKNILFEFIDSYYNKTENKDNLSLIKEKIKKSWEENSKEFFIETENIFDKHKWPKGIYTANLSIFSMYRLKPGTKVFSIPIEDSSGYENATGHIRYTLIHELMHIYVEDYYKKHFNGNLDKNRYYDLLEIVNFIVLNLPQIKKYAVWFTNPYPNHMQRCSYAQKIYPECKNMKEFMEKLISYLKITKEK